MMTTNNSDSPEAADSPRIIEALSTHAMKVRTTFDDYSDDYESDAAFALASLTESLAEPLKRLADAVQRYEADRAAGFPDGHDRVTAQIADAAKTVLSQPERW